MPNWTDAEAICGKVDVLTRDAQNRITCADVPGTGGKYRVKLERIKGVIWCRCEKLPLREDGRIITNFHDCLGNKESVCYHCLGVILAGVQDAGVTVQWFDSEREVMEVVDWFEKGLVRVQSKQSNKVIYGLVKV